MKHFCVTCIGVAIAQELERRLHLKGNKFVSRQA